MIEIEVQDQALLGGLAELTAALQNLSPAMRAVAGALADEVEQAFADQADPVTGARWPDLSETTKARRQKRGHWPGSILQVSGQLAASWAPASGPDWAVVGTNKVYATTQNFGARKGAFGQTRWGGSIPWGDIPARRMAPISGAGQISDDLREEILDIFQRHLTGQNR